MKNDYFTWLVILFSPVNIVSFNDMIFEVCNSEISSGEEGGGGIVKYSKDIKFNPGPISFKFVNAKAD
jgi:hypothetical protein